MHLGRCVALYGVKSEVMRALRMESSLSDGEFRKNLREKKKTGIRLSRNLYTIWN